MALTVGSLFAGIGGFDLGFERAGFEIKWQVEIDPFCRRVLEKHWPAVRRYEDVRTVHALWQPDEPCRQDEWHCDQCLPSVDVLVGGFPCQDISHAGRRAGIGGDRSGLWSEQLRLARELRPGHLLVENVPALLHGGMGRVLGDLAEIGLDAEWDCFPAVAFGAPHRRDRVWILAYPNGSGLEGRQRRVVPECAGEWPARPGSAYVPNADDESESGRAFNASAGASVQEFVGRHEWWRTEPDVGRVAHGIPARVDRLRGLGNAIVPQIAEWIARRILEAEGLTDEGKAGPAIGKSVDERQAIGSATET